MIWVPPEVDKELSPGRLRGGPSKVGQLSSQLPLWALGAQSQLGNSGRQFRTVGQRAGLVIHQLLTLSLNEWVMLLGTLALLYFWPALHKAKACSQKKPSGRDLQICVINSLQSVEVNSEGLWSGSDNVCYMPSFLLVECICVCSDLCLSLPPFFHSFLNFHSLWLIS